jgi:hypothetical protein
MGLLLLAQGWITEDQLRQALHAQRVAGKGRIGAWLVQLCGLSEERVTQALAMQWGRPVLSVVDHRPESVATLVPRLLLDVYGMLPLRAVAGRVVYIGFEDRVDMAATLAVERMSGMRVETGVVPGGQFLRAHEQMMNAACPKASLAEAGSAREAVDLLTAALERVRPHAAFLVRMHEYLWLRMWRTPIPGNNNAEGALLTQCSTMERRPVSVRPVPRLHQLETVDLWISMPQWREEGRNHPPCFAHLSFLIPFLLFRPSCCTD